MQPDSSEARRDLRILATNDDGIGAPGLWHLADTLGELGPVVVVAPDRDQSGVGTFTDLVVQDTLSSALWSVKTPSTTDDLADGLVRGAQAGMDATILL